MMVDGKEGRFPFKVALLIIALRCHHQYFNKPLTMRIVRWKRFVRALRLSISQLLLSIFGRTRMTYFPRQPDSASFVCKT